MNQKILRSATLLSALGVLFTGCDVGGRDGETANEPNVEFGRPDFVVHIGEDEDGGRVGISAAGRRRSRIVIEVNDPPASRQRVELRMGRCPPEGPWSGPQYLLEDLRNGQSENFVDVPLRELRADGYLVFVFPGPAANTYSVTCVDLSWAEPIE
jgi:hypothetical protein